MTSAIDDAGGYKHVRGYAAHDSLVVIGASAGGPAALATILRALPIPFVAPIVIVQHVDAKFVPGMAEWLAQYASRPVQVARASDRPVPGTIFLAGTDEHLVFASATVLGYVSEPSETAYRPSIDVLFQSVVQRWRGSVVGILLTGMGRDGAHGLKALRDAGAFTIAQDRATSVVYGMPNAAAQLGAAAEILPLAEIGPRVAGVLQTDLPPLRKPRA